jgi:hypothetical protein
MPVLSGLRFGDVVSCPLQSCDSFFLSNGRAHAKAAHARQLHQRIAHILRCIAFALGHVSLHRLLRQRFGFLWCNHFVSPWGAA